MKRSAMLMGMLVCLMMAPMMITRLPEAESIKRIR
jgi:hypothetical protein